MIAPSLVAGSGRSRKKTSLAVHPDAVRVTARTPTPMAAARTRRRRLPCWTRGAPAVITWLECRTDRLPRSVDAGQTSAPGGANVGGPTRQNGVASQGRLPWHPVTAHAPGTALPDPAPQPPTGYLDAVAGQPLLPAARQAWLAAAEQALERPGPPAPPRAAAPGCCSTPRARASRPASACGRTRCTSRPRAPPPSAAPSRACWPDGTDRSARSSSSVESLAVPSPAERWADRAWTPSRSDRTGRVDLDALGRALATPADLLCVQAANGEVGTRQPLAEVGGGGPCGRACRCWCTPSRSSVAAPCRPTGTCWRRPPGTGAGPPGSASCVVRSVRALGARREPRPRLGRRLPRHRRCRGGSHGPGVPRPARRGRGGAASSPSPSCIRERAAPARRRASRWPATPIDRLPHIVTFTCAGVTGRGPRRRARPARHQRGERLGLHVRHPDAQPGARGDGPGGRRQPCGCRSPSAARTDTVADFLTALPDASPRLGQDALGRRGRARASSSRPRYSRARDLDRAERRQVVGAPLHVEQALPAAAAKGLDERHQRDLRGVPSRDGTSTRRRTGRRSRPRTARRRGLASRHTSTEWAQPSSVQRGVRLDELLGDPARSRGARRRTRA